jgi:hypothetical protein
LQASRLRSQAAPLKIIGLVVFRVAV